MSLELFLGRWQVLTSGRGNKIPAGLENYLRIERENGTWAVKTQFKEEIPQRLGEQSDWRYQEGGENGAPRIYCTVTFPEGSYHFEAVRAIHSWNDKPVIYGHLFPKTIKNPIGEGGVGAWSADWQD